MDNNHIKNLMCPWATGRKAWLFCGSKLAGLRAALVAVKSRSAPFFVPSLLVAEFFIRNRHRRLDVLGRLKWPAMTAFAAAGLVFAYSIVVVSATHSGKFGKHLLPLLGG